MPRRPLECGDFSPLSCFLGASGINRGVPQKAAKNRRTPKADGP
jgi:hypothetical protein